ncbi:hypothetical protein KBD69_01980 [Candidatus Woesebacteria bacterium]|nr:hypothetical protein [Candidatus Woesebacteria bacterium]
MSLEKFNKNRDNHKFNLLAFVHALVDRVVHKEDTNEKEFFNSDRSRKWVFYKWNWGEGDESGQLNAALEVSINGSWATLMKGMMRWDQEGGTPDYGLEVSGINTNNNVSVIWYDAGSGGKKRWSGMEVSYARDQTQKDEVLRLLRESGVVDEAELPEYVDFESTLKLFIDQANKLDFTTPRLIQKKLIK